ncbi:hypothetical protein EIN_281290 [Entamoeba invadens IP1]|uniref:Uncharacterized protein n=1 Tax=Entamoeba invadens IP1 TaxID=370355 RepID=A0A0A1TWY8_ENTIV|nr:hypothetical protein EIN_281290 [Entamoeba invadens IP1]ELP85768.1 hypothetical protein EIN_281290 [Entamoeba invadens IP1]|eukprot:XP_004185114.1 hypothetical protein EIN_281290 [Entamoeba invadens IP1]
MAMEYFSEPTSEDKDKGSPIPFKRFDFEKPTMKISSSISESSETLLKAAEVGIITVSPFPKTFDASVRDWSSFATDATLTDRRRFDEKTQTKMELIDLKYAVKQSKIQINSLMKMRRVVSKLKNGLDKEVASINDQLNEMQKQHAAYKTEYSKLKRSQRFKFFRIH